MDSAPDQSLIDDWKALIGSEPDVRNVCSLRGHPVGRAYVLEASVEVDGTLTVEQGHVIATRIQDRLLAERNEIKEVIAEYVN